jgi:sugar phosphate permease
MKPSTVWIAIVLLALGVCGILDAAGVVASSQTIAQWWPVAIVGWALTEMLAERRITLGGVIFTAVGAARLADTQQWASDAVVWSSLAIIIGLAILVPAGLDRADRDHGRDARTAVGGGAS